MPKPQFNISSLSPLFAYLKKQQENSKTRGVIEITITLFVISFFLFFAIKPTSETISKLLGDIKTKQILTTKMKSKIDQVIVAQDNYSQIQEKYYLVEDALPSIPNYSDAYNQLSYALLQSNLKLDKFVFTQSDKNFFTTKIATSSSFASSLNLISNLLNSRRIFNMSSLTFSQEDQSNSNGQINLSLPLEIFFYKYDNAKK